ncbi:MAG TPA: phasin family protein [Methylobacterium sp.]|jgi:phasin family protein
MMKPFEAMPAFDKFGRAGSETMLRSAATGARTAQTLGIEWADFAKKSCEHGVAAMQKLTQARSPQTAMEIQVEFLKGSYERMVAQATLTGELYAGLAKDWAKPFEGMVSKRSATV